MFWLKFNACILLCDILAMCPVGRGCCLENSLDVKVSGVQIPNMACVDEGFDQWLLLRSENSRK